MSMSVPSCDRLSLKQGVLLAVYAPFGDDEVLSRFPDPSIPSDVAQHPLVIALKGVAQAGTHVVALIDRVDDATWWLEIPAGQPQAARFTQRWKQDMTSEYTLAGFLLEAHRCHPSASMLLSIEGHGAGYLPDIDRRQLTWERVTRGGELEWHFSDRDSAPVDPDSGGPVLPIGYPGLPVGYPGLPVNQAYMSTYRLGLALQQAQAQGCPKLAVLHFNNCFNMSAEVLHTVAAHAQVAAGYNNYNFFTSGAAYPSVFQKLQAQGEASAVELARWFADEHHDDLQAEGGHPVISGLVELSRMEGIAKAIDELADSLLDAMRSAGTGGAAAVRQTIEDAIRAAQQYDSEPGWELETPDQLTDVCSLAAQLEQKATAHPEVVLAARQLKELLAGIKRHGDRDVPWLDDTDSIVWDFTDPNLAMNIFLPDPLRDGLWDWRSTYYVEVNPDPSQPLVQPGVIEFLKATNWVDFLVEYHRETVFRSFHVGSVPRAPTVRPPEWAGRDASRPLPPCKRPRWPLGPVAKRLMAWLAARAGGNG